MKVTTEPEKEHLCSDFSWHQIKWLLAHTTKNAEYPIDFF